MKNNTCKSLVALILVFTMIMSFASISAVAVEDTKTYYFSNNKGWSTVYVHYWSEGGEGTQWPGVKATYLGVNGYNEGVYSIDVPSYAEKIVFTAGESGPQTVDIVLADYSDDGFYLSSQNEEGKWTVGTYMFDPSGITEGEEPAPSNPGSSQVVTNIEKEVTLVLKNTAEWETVCVYYWPVGESNPDWPGEYLEPAADGLYYATIPEGNGYVIFNNGNNGEQTDDLVIPTDNKILYDNADGTWSEMNLVPGDKDEAPKMTFLQKMAKALLIFLRTIEKFFKDLFIKK